MCLGPAALLGSPPLSDLHGNWKEHSSRRGMECSLLWPLSGTYRTFKLYQMLPLSICGTSLF